MDVAALLLELYGRIPPLAGDAVEGLTADQLTERPSEGANPIGWLVWHLTRVQDHHMSEILATGQVWIDGDWAGRFGLEPDPSNIGYGHSVAEVAAVRPEGPEVLVEYLDAVDLRTRSFLQRLVPADLDRIVDRRWDPPVTLGVRLISIADDSLQHAGQAAYLRADCSASEPVESRSAGWRRARQPRHLSWWGLLRPPGRWVVGHVAHSGRLRRTGSVVTAVWRRRPKRLWRARSGCAHMGTERGEREERRCGTESSGRSSASRRPEPRRLDVDPTESDEYRQRQRRPGNLA